MKLRRPQSLTAYSLERYPSLQKGMCWLRVKRGSVFKPEYGKYYYSWGSQYAAQTYNSTTDGKLFISEELKKEKSVEGLSISGDVKIHSFELSGMKSTIAMKRYNIFEPALINAPANRIIICVLVCILLSVSLLLNASPKPQEPVALFKPGDGGYACFRIPAIVKTSKGILLAFAEARKKGCSDTGDIDLVLRRSTDGGKTWGPLLLIRDDGNNVAGNPAPVVDLETGTVWLLSTWNLGADRESQIIDLTSKDTRRVFVMYSRDEGITWSTPLEITSDVKNPGWTWYATGPVHGIQLRSKAYNGRLVIPCDHIEAVTNKYFSHVIYSDDHGASWKTGGTTPQDMVNECTVAELPDGRLILNMRNYDRKQKNRKVSISQDGGESWSDILGDSQLIEPICQAALINITMNGKREALFFLNPSDSTARRNMTLKLSLNEGRNWKIVRTIHEGPAAYSDLVQLNSKELACLYEAGKLSAYEGIWFIKIKIRQIDGR